MEFRKEAYRLRLYLWIVFGLHSVFWLAIPWLKVPWHVWSVLALVCLSGFAGLFTHDATMAEVSDA